VEGKKWLLSIFFSIEISVFVMAGRPGNFFIKKLVNFFFFSFARDFCWKYSLFLDEFEKSQCNNFLQTICFDCLKNFVS
jgi:hypothetical protein